MQPTFSPARLESFSDGVIAVIITIMVLELKVPAMSGWRGLHQVVPTLLVYLLSYAFIGVYWVNHHQLIGRLSRSNNRILWANLVWLFTLSLIPFFTDYVADEKMDSFSVGIYSLCMLAAGAAFLLLRYAVDCQLVWDGRPAKMDRAGRVKHLSSLGIYTACVALAHALPRMALLLNAAVTLIWIVPTLSLRQGDTAASAGKSEGEPAGDAVQGHSR